MEEEFENPIEQDILKMTNLKTATPDMPKLKPFVLNVGTTSRFTPENNSREEEKSIEENPLIQLSKLKSHNQIESIPLGSYSDDKSYSSGTRPGDDWDMQYAQNQPSNAIYIIGGIFIGIIISLILKNK